MASDPFFPGGPPTTLVGALSAGLAIAGLVIRTLWNSIKDERKRNADLQDARIEDQKAHTKEILGVTEAAHQMAKPMEAAIAALKEQKKRTEN